MIRDISRFDNWFSSSYNRIRNKLECYLRLNEDAFHDTYLFIRVNLLFEKAEIIDFEPYFFGCYKKISLKGAKREQRYCHPEEFIECDPFNKADNICERLMEDDSAEQYDIHINEAKEKAREWYLRWIEEIRMKYA